jgi:hypothetical protein
LMKKKKMMKVFLVVAVVIKRKESMKMMTIKINQFFIKNKLLRKKNKKIMIRKKKGQLIINIWLFLITLQSGVWVQSNSMKHWMKLPKLMFSELKLFKKLLLLNGNNYFVSFLHSLLFRFVFWLLFWCMFIYLVINSLYISSWYFQFISLSGKFYYF